MDTSIFTALFEQVVNSPASLLVIIGISIIGYLLEIWPSFNSRYVPVICILAGPVAYPFFASRASVPPGYPSPLAVLIVNGLVAGLVASVVHAKLVRWLLAKYAGPSDKPNDQPTKGPNP